MTYLEKNDLVVFKNDRNNEIFQCQTEQFRFLGKDVVLLVGYDGEVNINFLEKVEY